ncbi:arylsulfatase [Flavisolibacter ginsenosidimutans]|uniref:Arylsulfatase n=1 Tax=Flavisolibacter ginsenosidimutans TaxID=661481 RepID=A0A5B8UD83_9BACT|nr:arylsulfatase [Flavisolibacter ginsenosidimutans]QEC54443.1 arylsulfatase [Flavisolibacter ginsenosidimutans]
MIFKTKTLLPFYCLCIFCAIVLPARAQKTSSKPNIIFILTDDLGYGDIGVFFQNGRKNSGDRSKPYELTPHIDQLAKNGAQFTQQYCNAPVCAPSRASLLTGVNQGNAHVRDNQFDKALENNHTVATVLKQAGYATVAVGKWGLQGAKEEAPNWPAHPLKRGFDHYFGYMRHRDGHEHYPVEGVYRGKKEVWEDYTNVGDKLNKCYTTDLWTAYAKKWIVDHEKSNNAEPFFMYLAYDAPHAVLELPTQSYPKGGGLKGGLQWLNEPAHMINTASGTVDSYVYPEYAAATYDNDQNSATSEVPWPDTYKRYATATKRIDDAVGDVLQLLKDLKIDNNTLVVFTSDNGPSIESYLPASYVPNQPTFFSSYGPFDGIKRDCWEGGVRMPTIASWPGHIAAGKTINAPSILSDWLATFADAANLPTPARTDGVSLLPSLTGKGKQENSLVYVEYFEEGKTPGFKEFEPSRRGRKRDQMQLIRMNDLVGVRYGIKSAGDAFEIYDVVKDPKQTKNLSSLPGFGKIETQMKAKVLQLRRADSEASRPYDDALVPETTVNKKLVRGLRWEFFEGDFPYVISGKGRKPQSSGTTNAINGTEGDNKKGMVLYEACIQVPSDGKYNFSFQVQGKAFVRLHEASLFDADFGYVSNTALTQDAYLKKGFHPLTVYLLKEPDQKNHIVLLWKKDGSTEWKETGAHDFYH